MNISGVSSSNSYYAPTGQRSERVAGRVDEEKKPRTDAEKRKGELSPEEADQVAKLKQTDREVRMHEMAHMAAGGGMITSGASYSYQKGPDGISYATGGEVGIDTSPGRTPEETVARAQRIRAAAMAPAEPSGQDIAVASQATQMEQQARVEMAQTRRAEMSGKTEDGKGQPALTEQPETRGQRRIEGFYAMPKPAAGSQVSTYA